MLNPRLYAVLCSLFGEVRVSKAGNPGSPPLVFRDPMSGRLISRWDPGADKGEEYQVCCPFCNDRHFHLYINHRYGQDYEGGGKCRIAKCFKGCLDLQANRETLWYEISMAYSHGISRDVLLKINQMPVQEARSGDVEIPLGTVPLVNLGANHPAVKYMNARGFDKDTFKQYSLSYCGKSDDFMLSERIIIPIRFNDADVAWQSRKIREDQKGPKYFSSPGAHLGSILYNFDVARDQEYVILTEGVADVWRAGPSAVCLFGKSLSEGQKALVANTWRDKPVLVMLDHDAQSEAQNILNVVNRIHSGMAANVSVPEEYKDPGNTPDSTLKCLIEEALWKIRRSS